MKRAFYDEMPSKIEAVGNGSYRYRWDIQSETVEARNNADDEAASEERVQYSCLEIVVWGELTSNKILEAVISSVWDNNREQKLINDYNAASLGVYGSKTSDAAKERIAAYTEFLNSRAALKEQIDADCAELNIE